MTKIKNIHKESLKSFESKFRDVLSSELGINDVNDFHIICIKNKNKLHLIIDIHCCNDVHRKEFIINDNLSKRFI